MKPTIGRIVHYTPVEGVVQAAIITAVEPDSSQPPPPHEQLERSHRVALHVFSKDGVYDAAEVQWSAAKAGTREATDRWCWPERV